MMSTTLIQEPPRATPLRGFGGNSFHGRGEDPGNGKGPGPGSPALWLTGVWVCLIPVLMLFLGLTSAMVVRQGVSDDWQPIRLPGILVLNTLLLAASSVTLEKARRAAHEARLWVWVTAGLGLLFLLGQLIAWRQLAGQGLYLASDPGSAFLYILTAAHGIHLLGGMAVLARVGTGFRGESAAEKLPAALRAAAVYWHFMGILWLYLMLLLTFWR